VLHRYRFGKIHLIEIIVATAQHIGGDKILDRKIVRSELEVTIVAACFSQRVYITQNARKLQHIRKHPYF